MNFFSKTETTQPPSQRRESALSPRTNNNNATAPLDEASVRALLDRLAFVERPVEYSDPKTRSQLCPARAAKGYQEPSPSDPNSFWFRSNLRGGLGSLNNVENNMSEMFYLPLGAIIDPAIIQYYALNGAYQFQIVKTDCELNFVPNEGASGMIFTTAIAQSPRRENLVCEFGYTEKFTLDPGPFAYPIDQDLNETFAIFDVDVRDARTVEMPHANAAAWLSINVLVRFDGVVPPSVEKNDVKPKPGSA